MTVWSKHESKIQYGLMSSPSAQVGLPKRIGFSLLSLLLIVSGLSVISVSTAPSASALTAGSGNCAQTYSVTGTGTLEVTEIGDYCYLAFKNTDAVDTQTTFSWTRPTGINSVDVLVVGGGGGGGSRVGGGGGGGGFVQTDAYTISSASSKHSIISVCNPAFKCDSGFRMIMYSNFILPL
jgi:hypothetical protein